MDIQENTNKIFIIVNETTETKMSLIDCRGFE